MIKYIGSKRTLVPLIRRVAERLPVRSACDLFAGTTRVGQALRGLGLAVHSNDLASYSEASGSPTSPPTGRSTARGSAGSCAELGVARGARRLRHRGVLPAGAVLPARRTAGGSTRSATRSTGSSCSPVERGVAAHLAARGGRPRRQHDRAADGLPQVVGAPLVPRARAAAAGAGRRPGRAPSRGSTRTSSRRSSTSTSSTSTRPTTSTPTSPTTTSGRRSSAGTRPRATASPTSGSTAASGKSAYNSRRAAPAALAGLVSSLKAPWLLVSVSNEGFHEAAGDRGAARASSATSGRIDVDAKRYVGAQIGIYNRRGKKVGRVSHLRNREHLLLAGPDRALVEAIAERELRVGLQARRRRLRARR